MTCRGYVYPVIKLTGKELRLFCASSWLITKINTVIPRLTSDPANEFFG